MKDKKQLLPKVLYLVLAAGMFYLMKFPDGGIKVGKITIMYCYLLGLAIIFLGAVSFLFRPQVERMLLVGRYGLGLAFPYFFSVFISMIVWVIDWSEPSIMRRGIFYAVYQIIAVLVAMATLYLFGEKGILLNFGAMALANTITMFEVIRSGGIAEFFRQFMELMTSFAGQTGDLMIRMEGTNLPYSFGAFFVFFLLTVTARKKRYWFYMALSLFFFLVSFKRSALLALVLSLMIGLLLKFFRKIDLKFVLNICEWALVVIALLYVWMIRDGWLDVLTAETGVNTNARELMYDGLAAYYSFGPFYLGKGLGWITRMLQTGGLKLAVEGTDLHNDFLRQYIELGFWGYLLWLISMNVGRVRMFQKKNAELGAMALCMSVFWFCTYLTENTYNLFSANITMALLMAGWHFEDGIQTEKRHTWG